jgi:hypothetical protein
MRESMTLLEQSHAFKKFNRQHFVVDRTVRHPPVYSSLNNVHDSDIGLKTLSFDVYTTKHLVTTGKSILPSSGYNHVNELILPPADINTKYRRRKKKRPSYRQSLYHSDSSNSAQADLAQLTARGMKREVQVIIPTVNDDDTVVNFQRDHAPPPSPSDDEIERLLYQLQDRNQSRPPSRQSPLEKEGYIPFRLPKLRRSVRPHRTPMNSPSKDIRSTLSNYLQRYY